jgi:hypothetical protein
VNAVGLEVRGGVGKVVLVVETDEIAAGWFDIVCGRVPAAVFTGSEGDLSF